MRLHLYQYRFLNVLEMNGLSDAGGSKEQSFDGKL